MLIKFLSRVTHVAKIPEFLNFYNVFDALTVCSAILDRFYFTPGKNLDYGDCSLTINPVRAEDFGVWTCAALLHDDTLESRDYVVLYQS